ncbi:hypothetical protein BY996DRAFT_4592463 [Phakopsora pachyrhizi]|uniref:SH3 domain-containing protein n=1 Tax=Phakopsora pachyrhizi TaxID=170000 RepID=A0AAV0AMK8_PHAPC|nr:hypothetical protein BY996DRAFT_4592463 [Phakopsora pachyrhizi]CAH7669078.1 hypothetical protein PPACK8108_LOCUS3649 [Phakopsora pachyrhizi]
MHLGNPLPSSLPQETRSLSSFVNPYEGLDGLIPNTILRSAHGFAIFTVFKAGFLMSFRGGTGLVIARLPTGQWSAPSAIGTGGMGFGGQAGAEVTEFVLVLNTQSSLRQFMSAGSITLGGNLSIALGPVGRNIEGSGALNTRGRLASMYSYSNTKGAFAGISIEGSAIFERQDCNVKSYGTHVTATKLLSGQIEPPDFAAELIELLNSRAGNMTEYIYAEPESLRQNPDLSSIPDYPSNHNGGNANLQSSSPAGNQSRPLHRTPDPYQFGTQNPLASSQSSSSYRPPVKKSYSVSSWINGSKRDRKSSQDFHQLDPQLPSNWDKSFVNSSLVGRWRSNPRPDHEILQGTESDFLKLSQVRESTKSITEIDPKRLHRSSEASQDFDSLTLSSISSDKEQRIESLNEFREEEFDDPNYRFGAQKSDLKKESRWYIPHKKNRTSSKSSSRRGTPVQDDLISFDRIGSPSLMNPFRSQSTPQTLCNKNSNDDYYHDLADRSGLSQEGFKKLSSNLIESKSMSERMMEGANNGQGDDFLIGTVMPSVSRTTTELAGFLGKAVGLYDFVGTEAGDLSFKKGDWINVVEKIDDQWWRGSIGMRRGIFPVNRVQVAMN